MSQLESLQRYWHTLRYLKPVQFYGRVWHHLYHPNPKQLEAAPLRQVDRRWQACARAPTMLAPNLFWFLNIEREINDSSDWNRPDWPKLWLYNLQYFDDLAADKYWVRESWHRELIARWITENPPAKGNGWEPYPISLRSVNWCKWLLQGHEPVPGMLESLAVQADLLSRKPEYHLLGNHLWANFKALIFCGALFKGSRADKWLSFGLDGFREQLVEQVLPDGGHFERSPMYQATLLEDILDLVQLKSLLPECFPARDFALWREYAEGMLSWLAVMSHPDGRISFFNDAAFGIAPELSALTDYARRLGMTIPTEPRAGLIDLADSGYCRLSAGDAVLLIDRAAVGPDHLPGHAHADTLSFELSLDNRRVLVNGGTSTYEAGAQRLLERRTAMHNTIEVGGQDSSEVWSAFRVARRARVFGRKTEDCGGVLMAAASHNGYKRLSGRVCHHRKWELGDGWLEVTDRLTGRWGSAVARFRLAPDVNLERADENHGVFSSSGRQVQWFIKGGGDVRMVDGSWHPEFGVSLACKVLEVELAGPELVIRFEWH